MASRNVRLTRPDGKGRGTKATRTLMPTPPHGSPSLRRSLDGTPAVVPTPTMFRHVEDARRNSTRNGDAAAGQGNTGGRSGGEGRFFANGNGNQDANEHVGVKRRLKPLSQHWVHILSGDLMFILSLVTVAVVVTNLELTRVAVVDSFDSFWIPAVDEIKNPDWSIEDPPIQQFVVEDSSFVPCNDSAASTSTTITPMSTSAANASECSETLYCFFESQADLNCKFRLGEIPDELSDLTLLNLDLVVTVLTALTLLVLSTRMAMDFKDLRESYSPYSRYGLLFASFVMQFILLGFHIPPPFSSRMFWAVIDDQKYYYPGRTLNIYLLIRLYTGLYVAANHCAYGSKIHRGTWAASMKLDSIRFQTKLLIKFNPALLLAPMTISTLTVLGVSLLYSEGMVPLGNIYTLGESLWCAIITGSSTGFGRRYPVTAQGRAATVLFGVVVGYTLLAFVTAYASEALVFDVHEEFIASCINRVMWQRRKEYLAASVLNCTARIFLHKSKGGQHVQRLHDALERAMLKHRWHASKVPGIAWGVFPQQLRDQNLSAMSSDMKEVFDSFCNLTNSTHKAIETMVLHTHAGMGQMAPGEGEETKCQEVVKQRVHRSVSSLARVLSMQDADKARKPVPKYKRNPERRRTFGSGLRDSIDHSQANHPLKKFWTESGSKLQL